MQGDPDIIELLNEVLTAELTAINQYFINARMCDNWGYERMGKHHYDESIDEMRDADRIIERILYLDGVPNLQRYNPVRVGETVVEQVRLALDLEREAIERYNRGVELATAKGDNGTRHLLEEHLTGEEEHADWLEAQLTLVEQMGEAHYLSLQVKEDD